MAGENAVSSVMSTLGSGSGIDIKKLAEDLTNVERVPAEDKLNARIEQETAQLSAYSVLKFNVEDLMSKLNALDDVSEILSSDASSAPRTARSSLAMVPFAPCIANSEALKKTSVIEDNAVSSVVSRVFATAIFS